MDNNDDLNIPAFLKRDKNWVAPPRSEPKSVVVTIETDASLDAPVVEEGPSHFDKIQRGMRESASELITEINEHYDAFILNGKEFNAYEFLRSREVKPAIAKLIGEKFQPQLNELLSSYHDAELKAAYLNIDVKESVKFLDGIISDIDRWVENQKGGKGPRKTRVVKISVEKKIKSLKFQKEDLELKLVSVAPQKIIGAQELWTYNTRYKHLTYYVARNRAGFMVKGTTLQDFDVENSVTKVLRKPAEVINEVLTTKKKKILDKLSTKAIVPTGRINENTILLKVG